MEFEENIDRYLRIVKNLDDEIKLDTLKTDISVCESAIKDMDEVLVAMELEKAGMEMKIEMVKELKRTMQMLISLANMSMKIPTCRNCEWRFRCEDRTDERGDRKCDAWRKEKRV